MKHSSGGQVVVSCTNCPRMPTFSYRQTHMHRHTQFQDVLHHYNWGNWVRVGNGVRQGLKLMSQRQAEVTAREKQR